MTTSTTSEDRTLGRGSISLDLGGRQVLLGGALDLAKHPPALQWHLQPRGGENEGVQDHTLDMVADGLSIGEMLYIPIVVPIADAKDLLINQGRKLVENLVEETERKSHQATKVTPGIGVQQMLSHNQDAIHLPRKLSGAQTECSVQQVERQVYPENSSRKRSIVHEGNADTFGPTQVRRRTSYCGERQHEVKARNIAPDVNLIQLEPNPVIDCGGSPVFLAVDDDGNLVNVATARRALDGVEGISGVLQTCSETFSPDSNLARRAGNPILEGGHVRVLPDTSTEHQDPGNREWVASRSGAECMSPWANRNYMVSCGVAKSDRRTSVSPPMIDCPRGGHHGEQQRNRREVEDHADPFFRRSAEGHFERVSQIQPRSKFGRRRVETEDFFRPIPRLDHLKTQDYKLTTHNILHRSGGIARPESKAVNRGGNLENSGGLSSTIGTQTASMVSCLEKSLTVPAPLGHLKGARGKNVIKGRVLEEGLIFPRSLLVEQCSPSDRAAVNTRSNAVHKGKVIVLPSQ